MLKDRNAGCKRIGDKAECRNTNVLFQGAFFHEGEEYTYFGSRKLPGHSLNKKQFCALPKPILDKNAEIVANFLYRLHSEKNVLPIQREGDVLVHGDFSLNHLLFDQNQMVCSVLDFGDSHVGDYQEDFLYLLDEEDEEEFGADFGREVLENYKSISFPNF